ncbi:uncharacterized protein LOC130510493 [Raphanus sativus]|uniref:Uncharacterized protein LOC130510493 n=1 Tax=Raphanus sativus TaxID=3726 RepID=A0A9W3DGQ7_RAPSA|nr:uncharacterized protein LOC130510493 [Raphanus sativus]
MASESPEVVVAPVMENGGAESSSSSKGKEEEQLESELSKKLEITEDAVEENEEDAEEDGSKGETSTKKKKKKRVKARRSLNRLIHLQSLSLSFFHLESFLKVKSNSTRMTVCGEQHLKRRESWSVWRSLYTTLYARLPKFIAR